MANKFDVFVKSVKRYPVDKDGVNFSISVSFMDNMGGKITSCSIVDVDIMEGGMTEILVIDEMTERTRAFAERLLEADEFCVEFSYKQVKYFSEGLAITRFAQILRRMTKVCYKQSGDSIKGNSRETPRNVKMYAPRVR